MQRNHRNHGLPIHVNYRRLRLIMPGIIQPAAYYGHFGLVRIFMKPEKPDITGQTSVITATPTLFAAVFTLPRPSSACNMQSYLHKLNAISDFLINKP